VHHRKKFASYLNISRYNFDDITVPPVLHAVAGCDVTVQQFPPMKLLQAACYLYSYEDQLLSSQHLQQQQ